jgi:hypothetical protein
MESPASTCLEISESLDAFHDGELAADEKARVESHLKQCEPCVRKMAEISQVVQALKTLPAAQMDTAASAKLDALLDRQSKVVRLRPRVLAPLAVAAAVAALVVGIKLFTPGTSLGPQMATDNTTAAHSQLATEPVKTAPSEMQHKKNNDSNQTTIANENTSSSEIKGATSSATASKAGNNGRPSSEPEQALRNHQAVMPKIRIAQKSEEKSPLTAQPAHNKQTVEQSALSQRPKIAAIPANAATPKAHSTHNESTDEIIATDFGGGSGFNEAIGLATDEDGLYDIKM